MTKDNWIKALHKTATDYVLSKSQSGPYDLAFSCDEEVKDLENLLSQVEKDAIEKTNTKIGEIKRMSYQLGYKEAEEKTNKRWRERVAIWLKRMKLECDVVECDCGSKLKDWDMANIVDKALSDLLEDKK